MLEITPGSITLPILYRDDDPNVFTDACLFRELHNKFINAKKEHTAAILMKDLWNNHALFWYLATAPYLIIGLHGWEHKDYSKLSYDECYHDLKTSLNYWQENSTRMTGQCKKIDTFFAPWNRTGENIEKACSDLGLKFCATKDGEWNGKWVKSFHWWNIIDNDIRL